MVSNLSYVFIGSIQCVVGSPGDILLYLFLCHLHPSCSLNLSSCPLLFSKEFALFSCDKSAVLRLRCEISHILHLPVVLTNWPFQLYPDPFAPSRIKLGCTCAPSTFTTCCHWKMFWAPVHLGIQANQTAMRCSRLYINWLFATQAVSGSVSMEMGNQITRNGTW